MLLSWKMLVLAVFYCCVEAAVKTSKQALFPAASRLKRGAAAVENPTFHNSPDDVNLLFEILLSGSRFQTSGEFSVQDAELASLSKTRNLAVVFEEIIPRKLPDVFQLISNLSNQTARLHPDNFERVLLTLVFSAQQMVDSAGQQRHVWAESFVSLYKAVKQDLTGRN